MKDTKTYYPAEGKINKDGELYIKRGAKFVQATCKNHSKDGYYQYCTHDCGHFGNPELYNMSLKEGPQIMLDICEHKTLFFDKFTDERVGFEFDKNQKCEGIPFDYGEHERCKGFESIEEANHESK